MEKVYMVQQIIKYSDGTETIINYKKEQFMENENIETEVVETTEAPAEETVETPEAAEEAPAASVEEAA